MKKVLVFILAALMLLSIVGCASTPPEPTDSGTQAPATDSGDAAKPQDGEQKSITYVTLGDTGMELLLQAAADFEVQTGVKVNIESWAYSDAYSKILTLAEGNNMPDAMYGFSSWTVEFKEAGYIVPAQDYISETLFNDFSEAARNVCTVDDTLWTLPSYMSVRSVLINRKAFDEAGIATPTTWEELLAAAPALCEGTTCNYAYSLVAGHTKNTDDCFLPILWAYGADLLSEDQKTVAFNTPEGVAALQMYVDLAKYSVPDYGEATINETQTNYTSQNAAAYFHNGQGTAALKSAGEDYSWCEIIAPLAGPGGEAHCARRHGHRSDLQDRQRRDHRPVARVLASVQVHGRSHQPSRLGAEPGQLLQGDRRVHRSGKHAGGSVRRVRADGQVQALHHLLERV